MDNSLISLLVKISYAFNTSLFLFNFLIAQISIHNKNGVTTKINFFLKKNKKLISIVELTMRKNGVTTQIYSFSIKSYMSHVLR